MTTKDGEKGAFEERLKMLVMDEVLAAVAAKDEGRAYSVVMAISDLLGEAIAMASGGDDDLVWDATRASETNITDAIEMKLGLPRTILAKLESRQGEA